MEELESEAKTAKVKVIGAGELGRRVVDIIAERQIPDTECIYLDRERLNDKSDIEYSKQVYQLEGIDLLVLVAAPEEINKHILILSEYASRMDLLVLGMTVVSSSDISTEENTCESLIRHGVDSVFVYYCNEYLESMGTHGVANEILTAESTIADAIDAIVSLINVPTIINLDIEAVREILKGKGLALTGTGYGKGASKATDAIHAAYDSLMSPLDMRNASSFIINVAGDITLMDVSDAAQYISDNSTKYANIMFGAAYNENMTDACRIVVIASGFRP